MAWYLRDNPAKDLIGGILLGSAEFVNWVKSIILSKDGAIDKHHLQRAGRSHQPAPDEVVSAGRL